MLRRRGDCREKDDGGLVRLLRPPYDGAKDYFYISDVDDRDYLASLIKATIPALPLVSHASVKSTAGLIPYLSNPGDGEKHHGEPQ